MSELNDPNCEQCHWWKESPEGEIFKYLFGVYDIDKAKKIVSDGREAYDAPISQLAQFISDPRTPKIITPFTVGVNIEHAKHVPMDKPIILAYSLAPRSKSHKRTMMPIDGHHRIARAILEGRKTLQVFLLTMEETDSILEEYWTKPTKRKKR